MNFNKFTKYFTNKVLINVTTKFGNMLHNFIKAKHFRTSIKVQINVTTWHFHSQKFT